MKILFRKIIRDIRKSKGQFISIFIIVVLGVMFYSGTQGTFRNLSAARDKYYSEYRFGDVWAETYKVPENIVKRIDLLPHVKKAAGRIVQDASLDISGGNATVRFITLPDTRQDIVNDISIQSGRYFSGDEISQCLVEDAFFKANKLKIGDYIDPVINGNKVKMKVIGSAKSPEFVYPLRDGSELMPDSKKFGFIYIKKTFGQSIFGFSNSINSISVLLNEGADIKTAKDDIEKELRDYGVKSVYDRDGQLSNGMLKGEIDQLKSIGGAFPVVFFSVAAVIVYIMMGRMVENQRTQIGVLKAFGFTNTQILLHYLSYSIIIAVAGSIVGSILGMYLSDGFTKMENMYFNLPSAPMMIYPDLALPASFMTLLFCMFAGFRSCKLVFRIIPSEAMRPKSPKIGKRVIIERLDIIWQRVSSIWRMIIRNVLRNKKRTLVTSIGIILSTALLLVSLGMMNTVNFLIDQQYENIQNYDIKVNFSKILGIEELDSIKNIPHVAKMEPVLEAGVEISNGWRKKDVGFTALVKDPEIYRAIDTDGNPVRLAANGIMLPERLSKSLGIKMNDTVFLKPLLPGKDKKEIPVKGIIAQYIGISVYSSMDEVNYIFGEGMVANAAVIKLDDRAYEGKVKGQLKDMPVVDSVQSKSDSYNALIKNMAAVTSSVGVLILLAAVLSIAVVYNIATINIYERIRELATLKVLGFVDGEIKKLIFYENYIISVLGILIGLPFGIWLGNMMMSIYTTDAYYFRFVTGFKTYILTIVLTLIFTVIANLILMKKIRSISMVDVLKSGE